MDIVIKRAANGLVTEVATTTSDGYPTIERMVFNTDRSDLEDQKSVVEFLYHILDQIGWCGSKHDPTRIRIVIKDQEGKEVD